MAEDTSKLLPGKGPEGQAAPTLEPASETKDDSTPTGAKEQPEVVVEHPAEETKKILPEEKKQSPPSKRVALMERVQMGRYKAVFRVLKEGKLPANLLLDAQNKWYLIHYLVMHNKLKELKVLVTKFDCDINIIDSYNQTPLHMAALHGKVEIFKYLLQQPMVQIDTLDSFRCSPLMDTIKSSLMPGFIYLYYEKGADIKVVDIQGFTVMHWAAYKNNVPLLQLFRHIPSLVPDTLDLDGTTPIYKAISGMSYESTKYLVKVEKVNLEAKSGRRQTPCEFAQSVGAHPKLLSYLKKHTALQKIERHGVSSYLRENHIHAIPYVIKYFAQQYGNTLGVCMTLALMLFLLATFWSVESVPDFHIALFMGIYLIYSLLLGTLLCRKDPGYLPMKGMENPGNAIAEITENLKAGHWSSCEEYCFACLIKRPRSTHHCLTCNRCVSGFQFHLKPLDLGLCIGEQNFPIYFFYQLTGLLCWLFYCCSVLHSALPSGETSFPVIFVEQWVALLKSNPITAGTVVALLILSVQKSYNIFVMLVGICSGMTVHELRHMHLYRYLFVLKDYGDQGKRYVHRKRSWGDCCQSIGNFLLQTRNAFLGIRTNDAQYIQLAEISHRVDSEPKQGDIQNQYHNNL